MNFKSSPRIDALVSEIIPGQPVWDFCCDHGLIGLHCMRLGLSHEIHFVDPVAEIMQKLKKRLLPFFSIETSEFTEQLCLLSKAPENEVRLNLWTCLGQNLPTEVHGTLIIAGVGGELTLNILTQLNQQKKLKAQKLVLCPNKDEHLVTPKKGALDLSGNLYQINNSIEVVENQRRRTIVACSPAI